MSLSSTDALVNKRPATAASTSAASTASTASTSSVASTASTAQADAYKKDRERGEEWNHILDKDRAKNVHAQTPNKVPDGQTVTVRDLMEDPVTKKMTKV